LEYKNLGVSKQNDVAPYISSDNRTMVPVRLILETIGADVQWDEKNRTVIITYQGKTLRLRIDEALPDNMGTSVIRNNRTFVPIRYISESFGAMVDWNESAQTITIIR
jgi:hypothetical protein